jgi:hypothetical protein
MTTRLDYRQILRRGGKKMVKAVKKQNNILQWIISIGGALAIIGIVVLAFLLFGGSNDQNIIKNHFPSLKQEETIVFETIKYDALLDLVATNQPFFVFLGAKDYKNSDTVALNMNQQANLLEVSKIYYLDIRGISESEFASLRILFDILTENVPTVVYIRNGIAIEKSHTYATGYSSVAEGFNWFIRNSLE